MEEIGQLRIQRHRDDSEVISLGLWLQESERVSRDRQRRLQQAEVTIADQAVHIDHDHHIIDNLNEQMATLHMHLNQMQEDEEEEEEDPEEIVPEGSGATQGSSGVASGSVGPPPPPAPGSPAESDGSDAAYSVNGGA